MVKASDGNAILMAQKLARQLGVARGITSGASLVGAISLQREMGAEARVVTVLCDSNKKYLSTDLVREEPVKPGYIAPSIDFTN